jgi:hypothetical protein
MSGLYGNPIMAPSALNTVLLEDENGNEIATGVVVGAKTVFTATQSDVKVGKIFASDEGVQEGTDTKTYRTEIGSRTILPNESFSIPFKQYDQYNYTKFSAMISGFNTTVSDSTSVVKVVINDAVYAVNSTVKLADVTKNTLTKSIDLNIINDTNSTYVIHYSTCKEE